MEPVVTPTEMRAIDAEATEPVEVLIDRAGWAVARAAGRLLGRRYGARVVVIAGPGNNGADGRVAARYLERTGVRCRVLAPDDAVAGCHLGEADLVIDAAFGTGFRDELVVPDVGSAPVLAVDVPSGIDGLTGAIPGAALDAVETVTFAALKPGLLFEPARSVAGRVTVVDVGLDCGRARCWHLGGEDLAGWPAVPATSHKWKRALWIIGGSPGLDGAPALAAAAAARAGAGYVAVSSPGAEPPLLPAAPVEAVRRRVAASGWAAEVLADVDRFAALVVGPGLATDDATAGEVRALVAATPDRPIVLDGGALDAVAADAGPLGSRVVPAVLTPHDGELARLVGSDLGPDRIATARDAAAALGAIVVAKGPTTVVAHPDGRALVSTAGDQRLATAGTGDVLAGLVGAALAGGLDPFEAAGFAVELHGRAATAESASVRGLVASDLPALAAAVLADATR